MIMGSIGWEVGNSNPYQIQYQNKYTAPQKFMNSFGCAVDTNLMKRLFLKFTVREPLFINQPIKFFLGHVPFS